MSLQAMAPFLVLVFLSRGVVGELYSALAGMESLVDTQRVIILTLDDHIQALGRRLDELNRFRSIYIHLENISRHNFQEFVSNPVNAFVLIKKLSLDWNEAQKLLKCIPNSELITREGIVFPDKNDLSGAAKALLRVQQTYGLETSELAQGKVFGATTVLSLTEDDCFELGRQAYHAGFFETAISWLELAREQTLASGTDCGSVSDVQMYLKASEVEKENSEFMIFVSNLLQLGFMSMNKLENPSLPSGGGISEIALSKNIFMGQTNFFDELAYKELCQSSMHAISPAYSSLLRCRLSSPHPYLILHPVKEEQLWEEPKISLYYDVISDEEMEAMKAKARPELQRAEVAEYTSSLGHRVSETRVTKIAWLKAKDHPLIPKLYLRIEYVTGLTSTSAEPFQMANYGLGGHFHLHMDVLPDTETYFGPEMGNRVATWMYYMSDVNGGGATVFPRLNITVWPRKGSALFWHNVNSNGVGNILTLHGACPVVSGSKWVTNVWYHERGQEFRLKCGTRPESALQQMNLYKHS